MYNNRVTGINLLHKRELIMDTRSQREILVEAEESLKNRGLVINENKIITSPGKFEALPWYAPYFYDVSLEDYISSETFDFGDSITVISLSDNEKELFGLKTKAIQLQVIESEFGFISLNYK